MMNWKVPLVTAIVIAAGAHAQAADCGGAAAGLADQNKGEILSVRPVQQGGKKVCVIRLRIPGKAGKPPRVTEFRVEG